MSQRTAEQICDDIAEIVRNFEGREYSGEVTEETLFFSDIGMTSIDAVVFAEKVEAFYGRTFPFSEFIARLREEQVDDIAVGDLIIFLHRHLSE